MSRIVLHVDMDSFYASVEKREDPRLKDKPVVVQITVEAEPKHGVGRGVVASCSYEARRYGVKSGMPLSTAHRLCPDAVYVNANFNLYEETSERIMSILRRFGGKIEKISIDEAFLDLTGRAATYQEAEKTSKDIKDAVKREEQLTCSIGVAPNKTVAKIASDQRKPDGLTVVTPEQVRGFLDPLPVDDLPGVGRKTREELEKIGVKTIGDLAKKPKVELVEKFGRNGLWMWDAANGVDETPVQESYEAKSLSTQKTFEEDTDDWRTIHSALDTLVEEVHRRAEEEGYVYRNIGVRVRFEDFQSFTKSRTIHEHITPLQTAQEYARQLLREFELDPRKVRLIGIRVSNLKRKEQVEKPLDQYI